MRNPARTLSLWGPPLVWMAVIFAMSAMPAGDEHHGWLVFVLRKIAHFSEYAILVTLLWRGLRTLIDPGRAVAVAYVVAIAYACTDELHQTFVSGRVGTPRDVLIDAIGAAVAAGLIFAAQRRRRAPERVGA